MLSESQLLKKFEELTLPADEFRHEDHLRLAWYLSGQCALTDAIDRLVNGIKRFADYAGAPGLYHETITLFYLYEIYARRQKLPGGHSWQDFRDSNPELFASHREFMSRHYQETVLNSTTAKTHYIPPNLPTNMNLLSASQ